MTTLASPENGPKYSQARRFGEEMCSNIGSRGIDADDPHRTLSIGRTNAFRLDRLRDFSRQPHRTVLYSVDRRRSWVTTTNLLLSRLPASFRPRSVKLLFSQSRGDLHLKAFFLLLGLAGSIPAAPVLYNFNFIGGSPNATGSFQYDSSTSTFSNVVLAWSGVAQPSNWDGVLNQGSPTLCNGLSGATSGIQFRRQCRVEQQSNCGVIGTNYQYLRDRQRVRCGARACHACVMHRRRAIAGVEAGGGEGCRLAASSIDSSAAGAAIAVTPLHFGLR